MSERGDAASGSADQGRASAAPSRKEGGTPSVLAGEEIADEVVRRVTLRALTGADGPRLEEIVHETIYAEQTRLSRDAEDPHALADRDFVGWLRHELAASDDARRRELVATIVNRYTKEITGHFDRRVYSVATRAVPTALGALFHGLAPSTLLEHRHPFEVDDRILIEGEIDALQQLVRHGTVVLAPTHVSNLDSVLLGHAVHRLGLPPVAYGAGLNLFSSAVIGFFMRNLGAYTVDRKKTDPLYRATLKEYTTLLLERGQHNLFFPGGTRMRSGAVERHLKKGLLGTGVVAYRRALASGAPRPRVFVVPCTLTYPLVLEASSLIEDFLRAEGGPHYVDVRDEFDKPRRWVDFVGGLLELDLRIHLRVGRALDPIGNEVDDEGRSHDRRGREVDPARYLTVRGDLVEDEARDAEYTRALADRLVEAYRRDTVALPTSALAFVVFERLRREAREPDLFRLLRGLGPERGVPFDVVASDVARLVEELSARARRRELVVEESLRGAASDVVHQALSTFRTYHPRPVLERRGDRVVVGDPNLLFYYRNRLEGHGLLGASSALPAEQGSRRAS